jgi:hypothetical protein
MTWQDEVTPHEWDEWQCLASDLYTYESPQAKIQYKETISDRNEK